MQPTQNTRFDAISHLLHSNGSQPCKKVDYSVGTLQSSQKIFNIAKSSPVGKCKGPHILMGIWGTAFIGIYGGIAYGAIKSSKEPVQRAYHATTFLDPAEFHRMRNLINLNASSILRG